MKYFCYNYYNISVYKTHKNNNNIFQIMYFYDKNNIIKIHIININRVKKVEISILIKSKENKKIGSERLLKTVHTMKQYTQVIRMS